MPKTFDGKKGSFRLPLFGSENRFGIFFLLLRFSRVNAFVHENQIYILRFSHNLECIRKVNDDSERDSTTTVTHTRIDSHITRAKRKQKLISLAFNPTRRTFLAVPGSASLIVPPVYYKIVKHSNNHHAIHKSLRMPKRFQVSDYKVHKAKQRGKCVYTTPDIDWGQRWEIHTRVVFESTQVSAEGGVQSFSASFEKWVKFIDSSLRKESSGGHVACNGWNGENLLLENTWIMEKLTFVIDLLTVLMEGSPS